MLARREVIAMGEGVVQLEPRVAKIEADVTYISSRVSNIEIDLRDMRKSMDQKFDATNGEFKAIRAEIHSEFKSFRAEINSEFKSFRAEINSEFKSARAESSDESKGIRDRVDRLWERVAGLRLMVVILGMEIFLVTKGSQSYHTISQWLSHFK